MRVALNKPCTATCIICFIGADELYISCKQCLDRHYEVLQPYNIFVVKLLDRLFDACIDLAKWTEAVEYGTQLTELYR
jgi:hypothetical protein